MSEVLRSAVNRSTTLEDVARVAGVSRATVSRVINGIRNVDPAIQESVRLAIASTGYVPNGAARSLVTRRAGSLALVVSGSGAEADGPAGGEVFTDPFFGRVVSGVFQALRPQGLHPVLMLADAPEAREQALAYLRQGNADGAMVVSTHAEDPMPALLLEAGVPAVLFGRPDRPLPISCVDLANRDGGRLAADHLHARGCRRVVTIAGPSGVRAARDRLAGFHDAMARHGLPYLPHAEADFTQAGGERAITRLLIEHPDTDGVFAANDLMAQGALAVLRDHGRRVPEDVAVVGFDDSSAATAGRPLLTTVRQPVEEMAAEMTRILLDHIARPERGATSVIFEPSLVVRQSA
ncbi:LacI family DNA-binding transcriptional regulator [Kitasatospora indigofera]|uniref:LacI family transcriptional regulator n=1 Tax=Kitasatospora indigofera TaxID=67307 RepID=A0A919FVY7_9ACTN|nr:LacI family DNA-binding transcriptional regulator [Kitasatospora indigofera]GHH72555.1 LacI family transcriptional regulator [Kitasatospora indigofera]